MNASATFKNVVSIAIGTFDGMHYAHLELINALDSTNSAIVVIEKGHACMTIGEQRQKYTKHPMKFYKLLEIKHLDARGFVSKLYEDFPSLKEIVIGFDFHFGKDRAFNSQDLQKEFSGKVKVIKEIFVDGISVHSNTIIKLIQKGDITKANYLLDRNYSISGAAIKGQGVGKIELFPTINVQTKQLLPKDGTYTSLTRINDEVLFYPSVTFIGKRLSTDQLLAVETHIYDQTIMKVNFIEIAFISFLRENRKFESFIKLKDAIKKDIEISKEKIRNQSLDIKKAL